MIARLFSARLQFARRHKNDDGGVALIAVIGLSMVMLILITIAVSISTRGMIKARNDQDWNAALAAAYAGADEYASRLSSDSTYQKYGDPAAPFSVATGSVSTLRLPLAGNENPAFGIGLNGSWAEVAGTSGRSYFRYEVDNSAYTRSGIIRIRSTGKVGAQTRSVVVNLKQKGFMDFLYFTEYEIMDPQISDTSCVPTHAFRSGGTTKHNTGCTEIQFAPGDTFDGPIHSNDTMRICGSKFLQAVTTSSTLSPNFVKPSGCDDATYTPRTNTAPEYALPLAMPPTNQEMANETRVDLPADVTRPGCMYTGPTSITFNADGTMKVVSPWTRVTQPNLTTPSLSKTPAECGAISALNSTAGATIPVLDQNLVFVQNVPTGSTDPNYPLATPTGFACTGTGKTAGWTFGTTSYPKVGETVPPTSTSTTPAYNCKMGDAFVEGSVRGAVTVAAQNFIYITNDISYVDKSVDLLGLVGLNSVWVWNPLTCTTSGRDTTCTGMISTGDRIIQAAVLSVRHTFQVQNYADGGGRGKLKVLGAIAQLFRGTVGTGNAATGYLKEYTYDTRLLTTAPPKFLAPTSTTYGVTQYADVAAAFNADGTERR